MSYHTALRRNLGWLAMIAVAFTASAAELRGTVTDADGQPVPGALVYGVSPGERLIVRDNQVMDSTDIRRALTGNDGSFTLDIGYDVMEMLLVIDMADRAAAVPVPNGATTVRITMPKPAEIRGRYLHGPNPVAGQEFTASWVSPSRYLYYLRTDRTAADGAFALSGLLPGKYIIDAREEVPQVGCCFRSVPVAHEEVAVQPGETAPLQIGGTTLPYLHGRIEDSEGDPLHGVWVSMWREGDLKMWSAVTRRDGTYALYDLPDGEYQMRCFRRLAQNSASDVLDTTQPVTIRASAPVNAELNLAENTQDVTINLEQFEPLKEGDAAPEVEVKLVDGTPFRMAETRGKVVVAYFYASWCSACVQNAPRVNEIAAEFGGQPVLFVGVNLDQHLADCTKYISEKGLSFPQIFDGPWSNSVVGKAFHVSNIPTSFVIDRAGNIAYIDVFGDYLVKAIHESLK